MPSYFDEAPSPANANYSRGVDRSPRSPGDEDWHSTRSHESDADEIEDYDDAAAEAQEPPPQPEEVAANNAALPVPPTLFNSPTIKAGKPAAVLKDGKKGDLLLITKATEDKCTLVGSTTSREVKPGSVIVMPMLPEFIQAPPANHESTNQAVLVADGPSAYKLGIMVSSTTEKGQVVIIDKKGEPERERSYDLPYLHMLKLETLSAAACKALGITNAQLKLLQGAQSLANDEAPAPPPAPEASASAAAAAAAAAAPQAPAAPLLAAPEAPLPLAAAAPPLPLGRGTKRSARAAVAQGAEAQPKRAKRGE